MQSMSSLLGNGRIQPGGLSSLHCLSNLLVPHAVHDRHGFKHAPLATILVAWACVQRCAQMYPRLVQVRGQGEGQEAEA